LNLKAVSYDKNSGVLLYITTSSENSLASIYDIFPSVIMRAFNIIGFESSKYTEISLVLTDYYD